MNMNGMHFYRAIPAAFQLRCYAHYAAVSRIHIMSFIMGLREMHGAYRLFILGYGLSFSTLCSMVLLA